MKRFEEIQFKKAQLREILIKGDRVIGDDSNIYSVMTGCILPFTGLLLIGFVHFTHPTTTVNAIIGVIFVILLILFKVGSVKSEHKKKEIIASLPKASDLVNKMISESFNSFKIDNPGKYFGNASSEEESLTAHRKWWKDSNNFNIQGFE